MIHSKTIKAVILGHAVADALGVPVEFSDRAELDADPVVDMRGYGSFSVPAGSWSDDTSMSLCALESLAKGTVDYEDVMENFGKWYYKAEFTPTGETFDIGNACLCAIDNYFRLHRPIDRCGQDGEHANGNGALMRIHPFVLYLAAKGLAPKDGMETVLAASALTHGHRRSMVGCGIYACVLDALLRAPMKASVALGLAQAKELLSDEPELVHYSRLFDACFAELPRESIKSGGYVVSTLEAALWCLLSTSGYKDCVLKAVNLGQDTDTTAAVAGGLAGALYGYEAIPQEWLNTLLRREYIEELCERAYTAWKE